MKFLKYHLHFASVVLAIMLISACEEQSNPTSPREKTTFTWDYVMDNPTDFHSIHEVPPLAVEDDGTVWIAGYLGTAGNSHRCMARRKPGGVWEMWADNGTPGDFYAYDVATDYYGGVYVTIMGNPTLEQSGLYQFVDIPYQIQGFQLIFAHPDPGPIACNVSTRVMFTRHMNNANSGIYSFLDNSFHYYTLPNVTGDVLCAAIDPNAYVAVAITSDGYILQWISEQIYEQQFPSDGKMYSLSGDNGFVLCTDQGLYRSDTGDLWAKDENFPGDKAYSHSMGSHEMILGEKEGERKVYKSEGGQEAYVEETLNYPVGVGRIAVNKHVVNQWHQGYIYDGEVLVERVAH